MTIPNTLPEYHGKKFILNTGSALPAIGLGTFQDPDEQLAAVSTALKLGYRHIDTAHKYAHLLTCGSWCIDKYSSYGTEKQIGEAIRRTGIPRHHIFLTTKLWCNAHHPEDVEGALDASLAGLGVEYVDLYLMHYPCAFKRGEELMPVDANGRLIPEDIPIIDTWRAMERLVGTGKVRAIGMSNFSQAEMEIILNQGSMVCLILWYGRHKQTCILTHSDSGCPSNGTSSVSPTTRVRGVAPKTRNPDNPVQSMRKHE